MKIKTSFILFLVFITALFSFIIVLSEDFSSIELKKGKNMIILNNTETFYVESLIKLNPSIEVVSYTENKHTVGYVNIFGGIGDNFIIEGNKGYEIFVNKVTNIILPDKSG